MTLKLIREYPAFVAQKLSPVDPVNHTIIGIINECAELGQVLADEEFGTLSPSQEYIEEAGDLLFYLTAFVWTVENIPEVSSCSSKPHKHLMLEWIDRISDVYKKWKFYESVNFTEVKQVISQIYFDFVHFHPYVDVLIDANMKKLSKRYASTFTTEESIERKDKCEG